MSLHHKPLPPKFVKAAQAKDTQWIVIQVLNPDLDWCAALAGAKLQLGSTSGNGTDVALTSPAKKTLGALEDKENWPPHLLVLRLGNNPEDLVSAGSVHSAIKIGSRLPRREVDIAGAESFLELKPQASDDNYALAPLMFWKLGPVPASEQDVMSSFKFTRSVQGRTNHIQGVSSMAPKMQLIGRVEKIKQVQYLLGAIKPGSGKAMLFEADVYWVQRDGEFGRDKEAEQKMEVEQRKALSFGEQRATVIMAAGAAQKIRMAERKKMRIVDDTKVVDIESSLGELRKRSASQKTMSEIKHEDALADHRECLPEFDLEASTAGTIYNIEHIAPAKEVDATKGLLFNEDMVTMLQNPARTHGLPRHDVEKAFGSSAVASLVQQWAEANASSSSISDAKSIARRFGVLKCLILMNKLARGKKGTHCKLKFLAEELNLPFESKLVGHWFMTLADATPTYDPRSRKIPPRKALYYMIVWALYLMPKFSMDFSEILQELRMDQKELTQSLRFAGCVIKPEKSSEEGSQKLIAELRAPLKMEVDQGGARKRRKK